MEAFRSILASSQEASARSVSDLQLKPGQQAFECPFCPKKQSSMVNRGKHIRRMHPEQWKARQAEQKADKKAYKDIDDQLMADLQWEQKKEDELRQNSFFAIDTETSRGDIDRWNELVEVAVVRINHWRDKDTGMRTFNYTTVYHRLFLPAGPITKEAHMIHGYDKRRLERRGARSFTDYDAKEILSKVKGCQGIIGHNVAFDRRVIMEQFARIGCKKEAAKFDKAAPFICTQELAVAKLGLRPSQSSLAAVYQLVMGEDLGQKHGAKADAHGAAEIWIHLWGWKKQEKEEEK